MARVSAGAVVFNHHHEVLLQLRRDIFTWGIPRGKVEQGEPWEHAAIRETLEETGYRIQIARYLGQYQLVQFDDRCQIFIGALVDEADSPVMHDRESLAVQWFAANRLPLRCLSRQIIRDALTHPPATFTRLWRMPSWLLVLYRARRRMQG